MTMIRFAFAAVLIAAPAFAAPPKRPAPRPAAAVDWTRTVVATPNGFRMGNPAAKVKLIEYGSFTCPHCRAFQQEATAPLKAKYIATGKVSFEFRSFVRNGPDYVVSLLAACDGAPKYFATTDMLFTTQNDWIKGFEALDEAAATKLQAMPKPQQMPALAKLGGIDKFIEARGLSAAKADRCLADQAAADRLTATLKAAVETDKVEGTPTFLIDGKRQTAEFIGQVRGITTWQELEPRLVQALR